MKKFILSSAIALSSLAVVMPVQNVQAQNAETVASIGDIGVGLNWLAKRINSIGISTLAHDMENGNVTERNYVAVFDISGALIQNYEMAGSTSGIKDVGRSPGIQILPYTVKLASDGRKFISVAAFAMKNMNKAYRNSASMDGGLYTDAFWTVMNSIEALVYEYDDGLMLNNTLSQRLDFFRVESKLDILNSSKPGHFLAIVGKVGTGIETQEITRNGELIQVTSNADNGFEGRSFHIKTGAGLEYNLPTGEDSALNASAFFNWRRFEGHNYNAEEKSLLVQQNNEGIAQADAINGQLEADFDAAIDEYQVAKENYEIENFEGEEISDETYEELTGNSLPESPDYVNFDKKKYKPTRVSRTLMYISPRINYTTKFGGNTSYEFSVFGNIPLRDDVEGGNIKIDLSGTNARPIVGAGVKIKF